jgi:hypothetical protein
MSDHLSGRRALANPTIDLTDLFAFPSPSRSGQLVLAMDVFPNAHPTASFSHATSYRLRVRPVTIPDGGTGSVFDVSSDEYALTCTFTAPTTPAGDGRPVQEGRCVLPSRQTVAFRVNDEQGGHAHGTRVFAGVRLDPFFMDVPREVETRATGRLAFQKPGTNTLAGVNVLSIVVELDVAAVLGAAPGTLFAVAAETVLSAGDLSLRLERLGRPEIKNILLAQNGVDPVNRDLDLRELYNQEDPFQLAPDYLGAYRARLNANLHYLDGLDGKLDWPLQGNGTHPLTELLLADFLVVDPAKPFAEDSYLEIERALLGGRAPTTSGGRSLNDDVIDTMYTLIVTAGRGSRVSDGVDQATIRASHRFPYLAPPNPTPPIHAPGIPTFAAARQVSDG